MKISYSSLNTWWNGDKERALAMINHEEVAPYPLHIEKAFSYGSGAHRAWELESKATGEIPAIFRLGGFELVEVERYFVTLLPSGDRLSGRIDAIARNDERDMTAIIDYKTGDGSNDLQMGIYHILAGSHYNITHGIFMHLNKATGQVRNKIIKLPWPTKEDFKIADSVPYVKALNWALTIIKDIKECTNE